jgi:hypothetical protein
VWFDSTARDVKTYLRHLWHLLANKAESLVPNALLSDPYQKVIRRGRRWMKCGICVERAHRDSPVATIKAKRRRDFGTS